MSDDNRDLDGVVSAQRKVPRDKGQEHRPLTGQSYCCYFAIESLTTSLVNNVFFVVQEGMCPDPKRSGE